MLSLFHQLNPKQHSEYKIKTSQLSSVLSDVFSAEAKHKFQSNIDKEKHNHLESKGRSFATKMA